LDSLRFGPISDERSRFLFDGVIAGIAGYGNAVGVPVVGGEIMFDASYRDNPLVNVMAVGLVPHERIARARASGSGNPVMIVGARTGRDGIHGASFASADLDAASESRRPAVQVGDPFTEKLLIEACIELIASGAVIGIQDMGAAGLTSAAAEMAARAGSGIELDLDLVPLRERGMSAYEIMLSESQERMLVVPARGREEEVAQIFRRWGLEAAVVGRVTEDGMLRVRHGGKEVACVPARSLSTDGAPLYHPPAERPSELDALWSAPPPQDLSGPEAAAEALLRLLAAPTLADKAWVYRQYDYQVQTNTVAGPGRDAAVLRVRGTRRGLGLVTDANGRHCFLDPRAGAAAAVCEAARNLACVGAEPLGITDGLNFGNPERPEVFWQFREAVHGIAAACRALEIPVTGGNVSFYNEARAADGSSRAVYPTPVIGMVGLIEDVGAVAPIGTAFSQAGDRIVLLGPFHARLAGSAYLAELYGQLIGRPAMPDFAAERALIEFVRSAVAGGWVVSAHDVSDGGLAVAVAECCIEGGTGAEIALDESIGEGGRLDATLFGEGPGGILVSVRPAKEASLLARAARAGVRAHPLGAVGGDELVVHTVRGRWRVPVSALAEAYRSGLTRWMEGGPSDAR
ncbi:MAG TPA: phosphoribosylformylglycinamidine synthase subunit PurL, partial [Limnochordia bacterium]